MRSERVGGFVLQIEEPDGIDVPGLPEGVLAVAYRAPESGEFSIGGDDVLSKLDAATWKWPTLIVKPAPGWQFVYSITKNCYRAVRSYPEPKRIVAHFEVRNSQEEAAVRAVESSIGFQRFEE